MMKPTGVLLLGLVAATGWCAPDPTSTFLLIWPTARATGLAGASVALVGEPDASFWNPGALGYQQAIQGCATSGDWVPGLNPGMYHVHASGGTGLDRLLPGGRNLHLGASLTYLYLGETVHINEQGEFLGRYSVWRGALGVHCGAEAVPGRLGVGADLKLVRHQHGVGWGLDMPEVGIDFGLSATGLATDIGALLRAAPRLDIGLSVANLGPRLVCEESGESNPLPLTARLGLCWTPVDTRTFRLRVLPELDKLLVGMFYDPDGGLALGKELAREWRWTWRSVGLEGTFFRIATVRLGYFEDLRWQRGGIVLKDEIGITEHYSLCEALTTRGLGRLKGIGLCWGVGIGLDDKVRLDFGSDAAVYDFPTANWKLTLAVNDPAGLLTALDRL